jgi:ankyrin repeat protein
MHTAIESDDMVGLKNLLYERPSLIDQFNERHQTALYVAVLKNNITAAQLLLNIAANSYLGDSFGMTPLHKAASMGNLEMVQLLYKKTELPIDQPDNGKATPLYWAAKHAHVAVVDFLLSKWADSNKSDEVGNTPLHAILKEAPSLRNSVNNNGPDIAVHVKEVVRLLVAHGADVNRKNNDQQTPLDLTNTEEMRDILMHRQEKEVVTPVVSAVPAVAPVVPACTWSRRIWNLMPSKKVIFSAATISLVGYIAWRIWRR